MNAFTVFACVCLLQFFDGVQSEEGKHWALLVAGSNTWDNYRHQADICHAYQILHRHGIPDERIVVMMYDDLANNFMNPTPGIVINHPNGTDVYKGVPKDYTGEDVNPETFIKVLTGDREGLNGIGSGKIINSGPDDHVFVNFADHGAPGLLAFPDDELYATDLQNAIQDMYNNRKYKQMVFYIEACESGSMFNNLLPADINVFATTAANSKESSYACYYDDLRGTYLGDVYSVNWMEDSDQEDLNTETLHQQFRMVKKETNTSHVKEFGDLTIAKEHVSEFQGNAEGVKPVVLPRAKLNPVRSEDVRMAILQHRLATAHTQAETAVIRKEIQQLNQTQNDIKKSMQSIVALTTNSMAETVRLLSEHHELLDHACYKPAVQQYDATCWDISQNDYALRQLYALVNLCEEGYQTDAIQQAIVKVCSLHLY